MEIKWDRTDTQTTFEKLNVGDIFIGVHYDDGCLFLKGNFMNLETDENFSIAIDLQDGEAFKMANHEPVKPIRAHVVVE